jgi:hypothetical protein
MAALRRGRLLRILLTLAGLGAIAAVAYSRFHRTPEQKELLRLVGDDLPRLQPLERRALAGLDRLWGKSAPDADGARRLLRNDVLPAIEQLQREAGKLHYSTTAVAALSSDYLALAAELRKVAEECIRVIDDPTVSQSDAVQRVFRLLESTSRRYESWSERLRAACRLNGIKLKG